MLSRYVKRSARGLQSQGRYNNSRLKCNRVESGLLGKFNTGNAMKPGLKIHTSEITSERHYLNRRQFIREAGLAAGAGIALGSLTSGLQAETRDLETIAGPYSTDETPNSWKDITTYNNFYEFGTGKEDPYQNAGTSLPLPGPSRCPVNVPNRVTIPTKTLSRRIPWKTGSTGTAALRRGRWSCHGWGFRWETC